MTRMKPIAAALSAIGMIALASPAYAGEVEELKATMKKMMERIEQLEAQQKSQAAALKSAPATTAGAAPVAIPANVVTAGTLPNSIKIPGTDTSLRVYGYAQLDGVYDLKGSIPARNTGAGNTYGQNNYDWASNVAVQPLNRNQNGVQGKNQFYSTMKTSRLGLETSTPIDGQNLTVKLEGDFNAPNAYQGEGISNSILFRLRHAYGEYGNFLVGQTWSNFLDLGSFADTVDFNGPGAVPMIRQPQLRYTIPVGASSKLALSVENPQSGETDRRPDVTANFTTNFTNGHLSLRAVTLDYKNSTYGSKQGWGLGAGGSYKLTGNDTLVAQINGGKGIGRYMLNSYTQSDSTAGSQYNLWTAVGGHVGYTHAWNEKTRSNLIMAYTKFSGTSAMEAPGTGSDSDPNKHIKEISVNTFWRPMKNTELGLEYAWGQRETFAGDKGTQSRVNATARFTLF